LEQIFATTDAIAERVRKLGGTTLRSIGHIGRMQRVLDNDADFVSPSDMLAELRDDNKQLAANMVETHDLCDEQGDVASASLLEVWIDETERRTWFLFQAGRTGRAGGAWSGWPLVAGLSRPTAAVPQRPSCRDLSPATLRQLSSTGSVARAEARPAKVACHAAICG
jgi:hypothetical protein